MNKDIIRNEILEKLQEAYLNFYQNCDETLYESTDLIEDLQFDSLDILEFALEVEDKFNIMFTNEEAQNFRTIEEMIKSIEKKISNN